MRRDPEAAKRALERRRREDAAARLRAKVPELERMSIHIKERPADGEGPEVTYSRHVVVERAPALFVIPCGERKCRHGGHDLTRRIMRALRQGKTEFEGKHRCDGTIDGDDCLLELRFAVEASYG